MKYIFTLIICMICAFVPGAYAQGIYFEPGYVILNGDTTQGFIKRTDEIQLGKHIKFKTASAADQIIEYNYYHIQGFGFTADGTHFSPVEVEIRKNNSISKELRFAKHLARGATSLYKLQLDQHERTAVFLTDNTYVYVFEKEGAFHTLGLYEIKYGDQVRVSKQYIGVLRAVMNDCLNGEEEVSDQLSFKDQPLSSLVKQYNQCKDPNAATTTFTYKHKPSLKHGIEASYNKFFTPSGSQVFNSHGYSAGYFWDISKPDISRVFSQRVGINYFFLHFDAWDQQQNKDVSSSVHIFRVPLQIQLNINNSPGAKVSPFFAFGFTGLFATNNSLNNYGNFNMLPMLTLGGGAYTKRLKFSLSIDNRGFSIKSNRMLSLGLGLRLDKQQE